MSREKFRNLAHEVTRAYEDLRDTQEKLIETEKMASVGRLAAAVSHEIRNPLGAIRNSVGVFKDHMQCSSEDAELFDIIEKEINRLNKLATDFLEFARPAPLNKQKANLHRLIEDALCLLFPDERACGSIDVETEYDPAMPEFYVDKDAINQVLWNILTNAVQAMSGGGKLTLKTTYNVTMLNDGRYREASIAVSDTGWGMTEETLAKAFQPFFSTKAKGSGIGLSIVQRIVRQHGGNVAIASVIGAGTTVTINLPVE
jgi:signal transduction histidine kinase